MNIFYIPKAYNGPAKAGKCFLCDNMTVCKSGNKFHCSSCQWWAKNRKKKKVSLSNMILTSLLDMFRYHNNREPTPDEVNEMFSRSIELAIESKRGDKRANDWISDDLAGLV